MKQLAFLFLFLFIAFGRVQAQEAETRITLHTPTTQLDIGDEFTVDVQLDTAPSLYGYDVRLQFDPDVVEIIDTDDGQSGVQLTAGTFFAQSESTFLLLNEGDNEMGQANFAIVLVNPAPAVAGSGILFSVPMRAIANGDVELSVLESTLATKEIEHVPHAVEAAEVQVGGFSLLWIGLGAGLLLVFAAFGAFLRWYWMRERPKAKTIGLPAPTTQPQIVSDRRDFPQPL